MSANKVMRFAFFVIILVAVAAIAVGTVGYVHYNSSFVSADAIGPLETAQLEGEAFMDANRAVAQNRNTFGWIATGGIVALVICFVVSPASKGAEKRSTA